MGMHNPPFDIYHVDMENLNPKEFWKLIDTFKNEDGAPSEKSGNFSPEDWAC